MARLQYLAEMRVGKALRQRQRAEDEAVSVARQNAEAASG